MTFIYQIIIFIIGYVFGFLISSLLLRSILHSIDSSINKKLDFKGVGIWIGICEYFLIVTFVIANEFTAIGLLFAAKVYVSSKKVKDQSSYYLLGTLLNMSFAVLFGVIMKYWYNQIS
jgi:hypothetical protein